MWHGCFSFSVRRDQDLKEVFLQKILEETRQEKCSTKNCEGNTIDFMTHSKTCCDSEDRQSLTINVHCLLCHNVRVLVSFCVLLDILSDGQRAHCEVDNECEFSTDRSSERLDISVRRLASASSLNSYLESISLS
jgi:hypothetical protein